MSYLSLSVPLCLPFAPVNSAVVEARASYEASEASLGDVPDEFLDPVLCHVMRDPVLLPTSGTILDRCGRRVMRYDVLPSVGCVYIDGVVGTYVLIEVTRVFKARSHQSASRMLYLSVALIFLLLPGMCFTSL